MVAYGDVINRADVKDVITGPVAASTSLVIGLVYEDAANGWKQAPVDGSISGQKMYWLDRDTDNSSGSLGDKIITVYGDGAIVVGKADGAIPVDGRVKASTTASHNGQFISNPVPTVADEGDTSMTDLGAEIAAATQAVYTYFDQTVGKYLGNQKERTQSATSRTAAADEDTDCLVKIIRN